MKKLAAVLGSCLLLIGCWGSAFGQQYTISQALNIVIAAGKTITFSNTMSFAATDGTAVSFPLPANLGGAGTINGALKGNGSGTVSQAVCADLSNGATGCSTTYTTGAWSPTVTTNGTTGTPAYSVQDGSYETIGRFTTARFTITLSGWTGSPTGTAVFISLPVNAANVLNNNAGCSAVTYTVAGLAASNYGITGQITANSGIVVLYSNGNTGISGVTPAHLGTTFSINMVCSYRTS